MDDLSEKLREAGDWFISRGYVVVDHGHVPREPDFEDWDLADTKRYEGMPWTEGTAYISVGYRTNGGTMFGETDVPDWLVANAEKIPQAPETIVRLLDDIYYKVGRGDYFKGYSLFKLKEDAPAQPFYITRHSLSEDSIFFADAQDIIQRYEDNVGLHGSHAF